MALVTFEDYPSTNTPLNSTNLNNNFSELSNIITTDIFTSSETSVATQEEETFTISGLEKTGYTPIGILFIDMTNNVDVLKWSLYGTSAYVRVKNLSNTSQNVTITIKVLYVKNFV